MIHIKNQTTTFTYAKLYTNTTYNPYIV
jgi:hypothetical protein